MSSAEITIEVVTIGVIGVLVVGIVAFSRNPRRPKQFFLRFAAKKMTATTVLSIRARQALGAAVVEEFCHNARIQDRDVDAFVTHLWGLACAANLPKWEKEGNALAITGLGDPLPRALVARIGPSLAARLAGVLDLACEISMSQIYAAYRPKQSDSYLQQAIAAAGLRIGLKKLPSVLLAHEAGTDGWGEPIANGDLAVWQKAARDFIRS